MKKFYSCLREHDKNIIDFEKKEMLLLTKQRTEVIPRCKSMLYLWKKNLKKAL